MKNKIKLITAFVLGALVASVSVYAISVKSTNVKFIPDDETWEVTSVEGALNDLNNMVKNTKVYYLGSGSSYNIKNKFPDIDYTKLSEANFIVGTASGSNLYTSAVMISGVNFQAWAQGFKITKTYNKNTGVLTISGNSQKIALRRDYHDEYVEASSNQGYPLFVYLVLGEIENA